MKKYILSNRQLCDLELLTNGGFAPLQIFMDEETYNCVLRTSRLPNTSLFPIPIVLDVPFANLPTMGEEVILTDRFNAPLARMKVQSIFKLQKKKEAESVYGTLSKDHFGVKYIFDQTHDYAVSGPLELIRPIRRFSFTNYRKSPTELKKIFNKNKLKKVVAFQTRNPIHRAHYELLKLAAKRTGAHVLVHPVVGETQFEDISSTTRIKSYIALYEKRLSKWATLSLLPLAMRMGGPKEALLHAIIRKNYGATHFIIGRDHASPGKKRDGAHFYDPYTAQEFVKQYEEELGIEIVCFHEMVYVPKYKKYIENIQLKKSNSYTSISGTQVRKMLRKKKTMPTWFTFPEITQCLSENHQREYPGGLVIFFTGLPSSGKSTLAQMLYHHILEHTNLSVTILDGDVVRQHLSKGLGFSKEDRHANILRIGYVASEVARHGGIAICSAIAPYEMSRRQNKELISKYGTYFEVYLSTPLQQCMKRDVKNLYRDAKAKKIPNVSGIDSTYEIPNSSDITIDTSTLDEKKSLNLIIKSLRKKRLLSL